MVWTNDHSRLGRQGWLEPLVRARLTDRLIGVRVASIVAPPGYGKSTLIGQLSHRIGWATVFVELPEGPVAEEATFVAALRRGLRAAGLRLLAEAVGDDPETDDSQGGVDPESAPALASDGLRLAVLIDVLADRDDPLLFVVDEAQRLEGAAADLAAVLCGSLPSQHHIAVAGQAAASWSAAPAFESVLGPADLAFSAAELVELAEQRAFSIDPTEAEAIIAASAGWPAAVALAVETRVTEPRALRRGIGALLERVLAQLDDDTRQLVTSLAQLPLLSAEVARAVAGEKALERMLQTGIPLRRRPDGWLVVPEPVRDALADEASLSALQAADAAAEYADAGDLQTCVALLLGRQAYEDLALLLESRPWQDLQLLEPVELRSLLGSLPDSTLDEHPRLLLAVARVGEGTAQMEWRRSLVGRAAGAPAVADDPVLLREVLAEQACDASYEGDVDGTEALASRVLREAGADEARTRARALVGLGRAKAFARDPASMIAAADALTEASSLLRLVEEPELRAHVLLRLGYSVYFAEGDIDAGLTRTREAVDTAPYAARERATALTFHADVLVYGGQLDEADGALREVAEIARRLRDQRLLGYHGWMKASIASRRADSDALATWLAEVERHPGDWFQHPTGIEFLAEAVDMWGRIGDHERAALYLGRVEARCAADPHEGVDQIALVARAVYGARAGDPQQAEKDLVAVLETEQLPRRETWRIHLLRGLAAHRAGADKVAAAHAGRAFEEANALGHSEWPALHEPLVTEALLPLAARAGSRAAATATDAPPRVAVRVLGDFAVTVAGRPAEPPPGRPATLVKYLAVYGRPVAVDEVVEALWPEVDPDTGRARLRNVLARVRAASGDLVGRDGNALALSDDAIVDAVEFEREARSALSTAGEDGAALARRAIARYAGELLPADRYEDFTVSLRERLALLHLALLDRVAADAEQSGDVDEALRRYSDAIDEAPLDEHRYERAAALALRHGRRQRASELIEQATRVLADLGVEPSVALQKISRELREAADR